MFGWRKNRNKNFNQGNRAQNSTDMCVCPHCKCSTPHIHGVPCFTLLCPTCKVPLVKQSQNENSNQQCSSNANTVYPSYPIVDTELCSGCGACLNACLADAIIIIEEKAKINNQKCINCRACVFACPTEAIK